MTDEEHVCDDVEIDLGECPDAMVDIEDVHTE
jgi:hypothetical protein